MDGRQASGLAERRRLPCTRWLTNQGTAVLLFCWSNLFLSWTETGLLVGGLCCRGHNGKEMVVANERTVIISAFWWVGLADLAWLGEACTIAEAGWWDQEVLNTELSKCCPTLLVSNLLGLNAQGGWCGMAGCAIIRRLAPVVVVVWAEDELIQWSHNVYNK